MREVVRNFARDVAENFELQEPVVEMGARAAEGQEDIAVVRGMFKVDDYIGCDIQEGLGVDRIEDIHALKFDDESVGTVVCVEVLEHVHDPLRAVREIHRVLKPGGIAILTSVMFFPIHEHPWDFWRFTPEGFELVLRPFETSLVFAVGFDLLPEGVFGVGVKGPFEGLRRESFPRTDAACRRWGEGMPVDLGPIRMTIPQLWRFTLRNTLDAVKRRSAAASGQRKG